MGPPGHVREGAFLWAGQLMSACQVACGLDP